MLFLSRVFYLELESSHGSPLENEGSNFNVFGMAMASYYFYYGIKVLYDFFP